MANSSGPSSSSGSSNAALVDLYRWLELAPLEADVSKIKSAIKALHAKAQASPDKDRLAKIVALGQKFLLDPERKGQYDRQWKSVYAGAKASQSSQGSGTMAESSTMAETSVQSFAQEEWDYSTLEPLLPGGDPHRPFDMAAFLRDSESNPTDDLEADFTKLMGLLTNRGTASALLESEPMADASSGSDSQAEQFHDPVESQATAVRSSPSGRPAFPKSAVPSTNSAVLAARMRAKRQRTTLMISSGLLVVAAGVLAIAAYMNGMGRKRTPSVDEQYAMAQRNNPARSQLNPEESSADLNSANAAASDPTVPGSSMPQPRSGLPMPGEGFGAEAMPSAGSPSSLGASMPAAVVPGADKPETAGPAMASDTKPSNPGSPATNDPLMSPTKEPDPSQPVGAQPSPTPQPNATNADSGTTPATPAPMAETSPAKPSVETPPVKLTSAEKNLWKKEMEAAKQLIGKQQFDEAGKALEELAGKARIPRQKEQLARLQLVSNLSREFHEAIVAAIAGLGAAETIRMGTTSEASFVEGSETNIAVRVSGRTLRFTLDAMPIGLAFGLADLKLDVASPTTLAKKGAFSLVHPKSNSMNKNTGKRMLTEAAQAGAVPEDFPVVYDEDYSLADVGSEP